MHSQTPRPAHGETDPRFARVREAFEESLAGDPSSPLTELGASVCVYFDGKPVVDLWGGHADEARTIPWERETIVCVMSVSKGLLATCALVLADEGLLDLDKPVSHYWPEFGVAGKEQIPVRWAMSHKAGLPAWERPVPGMGYDWQRTVDAIAASKPDLVPGREPTYHPYTFGHIVGGLIERIAGVKLNELLETSITRPLGADFRFGVRPGDHDRVATFSRIRHGDNVAGTSTGVAPQYSDIMRRSLDVFDHNEDYNSKLFRECVFPAANGHSNGRALARVYAVLANGGELNGVRIARPETIAKFTELQWSGDLILPLEANVAVGYMLNCPAFPAGPNPKTFGHSGFGGAYGFADPENRIAFGYTPNKLWIGTKVETGERCNRLVEAVYACVADLNGAA
jgi:CubicO group peptidase (beta-lactamase class C family)